MNKLGENTIIVTRHAGLVEWLRRRGIVGDVCEHARPTDVAGRDVIGILPMNLAALAASVTNVDMDIPADRRGTEFTADDMDKWGARLNRYKVEQVK